MRALPPAIRTIPALLALVILIGGLVSAPRAQLSPEEQRKRDLFLRARESIEPAPRPTPAPTAAPRPQPRPRPTPGPPLKETPAQREDDVIKLPPPRPLATPTPLPARETGEEEEPAPRGRSTPEPPPPKEEKEPVRPAPPPGEEIKLPPPKPLPSPAEAKSPAGAATAGGVPEAPILIEKSGLEEEQGLLPPPKKERRGFLGFGGGAPRYRYLTRGVRAAIDDARIKRGRWKYIIVHNSGTRQGNARIFNNYHRNVRKMQNGLAYHFVIGNGTSSGNGEIEIGPRWTRQINGGHVASDYLNNISIGICFVGDYNRDQPTTAQLEALDELIRYLRDRLGKSKGRSAIVKAHREINPKPTDCPGNRFPYRWLHRRFGP